MLWDNGPGNDDQIKCSLVELSIYETVVGRIRVRNDQEEINEKTFGRLKLVYSTM